MRLQILAAAMMVSALAACGPKPQSDTTAANDAATTQPAATQPAATAESPASAPSAAAGISIDPSSLADCNAVEATVTWDVREKHPNATSVEIFVGPDSAPTLFAAGGPFGNAKTGPWTNSGAIFRVRDKTTGDELERATVSGPACN